MHIITFEDHDFPELLELYHRSPEVGRYTTEGQVQIVRANKRLVMVSPSENSKSIPKQITITPVRNREEAVSVAQQLLEQITH
ncbi:hypothetical protein MRY87_05270 [bacterium]|nr:hypothetical protein [bacterium]